MIANLITIKQSKEVDWTLKMLSNSMGIEVAQFCASVTITPVRKLNHTDHVIKYVIHVVLIKYSSSDHVKFRNESHFSEIQLQLLARFEFARLNATPKVNESGDTVVKDLTVSQNFGFFACPQMVRDLK